MKNLLLNRLNLNLLLTTLLVIVVIPLNLAISSDHAYTIELFVYLILAALILSLILIFLFLIIKIPFKPNIYSTIVEFLLLWIFIIGIFFPVSGLPGPFLNLDLTVRLRYIILFKIVLFFLFYLFLITKDKKKYFFRFVYFFIFTNILFLSLNIQKDDKNHKSKYSLSEFGNKNLIILSFDGISGHKMYEQITNDKKFYQSLKDFKFYKNTVSGAPHTWPSINIEINGKLKKNTGNNILNNKNIDTLVYGTYGTALLDKSKEVLEGTVQDYSVAFKINTFFQNYIVGSVGRWATPIGTILAKDLIYTEMFKNIIDLISINIHNKPNPYNFIQSNWNVNLYEYDVIFDNVTYNENLNNVVRAYHFIFSHWPVTVNEHCKEVKSLDDTINSSDQELILIKCVSKKIIKFLNNLKNNKIYNNSMIVLKSDHGKPNCTERTHTKDNVTDFFGERKCSKYYKEYPYTEKLNNNYYWGYGRYMPFIMVKDRNQTRSKIEISNKQVFLHDLSTTYCNFFFKSSECNYFNKNNLAGDEQKFSIYDYDIYIPKLNQPLNTTNMEGLKKYTMSNDISFLDFLKLNKINSSN